MLGRNRDASQLRELVIASLPYPLYYRVSRDQVLIVRVVHGAMNWSPL